MQLWWGSQSQTSAPLTQEEGHLILPPEHLNREPQGPEATAAGSRASSDGSTPLEAGLCVLAAEAPSCPGSCLPQGLFGQFFPQFLFLLIIYKALYDHRC